MGIRRVVGVAAIVALLAGLNLLVWQRTVLSPWVAVPLGISILLGLLYLVLSVVGLAGKTAEGRGSAGLFNAAASSLVFLAICITVYAFAERWNFTWDLTEEGRRTLAPQTVQVLQTLTATVDVTCYFPQVDDELVVIARQKTMRFLNQCQEYTELLKVTELDPQVELAQLNSMGISHVSPQGTVVVKSGARQRVITLGGGSPRLEERDFTNALINILRGSEPTVYFLQGHDEAPLADKDTPSGAAGFVDLLTKESYKILAGNILPNNPEVPMDCDLLILMRPQGDLFPHEVVALDAYLNRGGRVLVMINPLIAQGGNLLPTPNLVSWLHGSMGVDVGVDLLLIDAGRPQKLSQLQLTINATPFESVNDTPGTYQGSFRADHPITKGLMMDLAWTGVRSVRPAEKQPENAVVTPLLRTPPQYWAETNVSEYVQSKGNAERGADELQGPVSVAVAAVKPLTEPAGEGRPKDARVVVVGDADLMLNEHVRAPANFNFIFNAINWLGESEELIAIRPSGKEDPPIILSAGEERAVVWVSCLATLQAVLLAGLAVYLVRRGHR